MSVAGRKATTWDIRRSVEDYDGMKDDAFNRRFFADRQDLSRLGIGILSDGDGGGSTEAALYWLPPENYRLPPIDFSPGELAALNSCLWLLEGQFAYSDVLRLALQALSLAAGRSIEGHGPDYISLNLLPTAAHRAAAARMPKIEHAIAHNKSILFNYRPAAGDGAGQRRIDPYALMTTRGNWYMIGYSHERDGIRIFRLDRIEGKIRNATKKAHDFKRPADFDVHDYLNLEPWQLGPAKGTAQISLSPRIGWQVERELAHCGSFQPGRKGETLFSTAYADEKLVCALVLGMETDATLLGPESLRRMMGNLLEAIAAVHSGEPAPVEWPAVSRQPRGSGVALSRQVKPERFTRLSTLSAYLTESLGGEETVSLAAADVAGKFGYENIGELKEDIDLLQLVCIDAGGYLVEAFINGGSLRVERSVYGHLFRRPPRLSPLEARALLLAIDLVGEDSLSQNGNSLKAARGKIIAAAGGDGAGQAIVVQESGRDDRIGNVIATGIRERRLVEIDFLSEKSDRPQTRRIEPYLIVGGSGERYVVSYCRLRQAVRTFRSRMIRRASLLEERFQPREIDLDRYRGARLPFGGEAPLIARVRFSAATARFVNEKLPGAVMLADGSLADDIRYFNVKWLIREVLKYGGEATVLAPEEPRRLVAAAAKELAQKYC